MVLGDTTVKREFGYDPGIAAYALALAARDRGLGACIIATIDRPSLREALSIPEKYDILLTVAVGAVGEEIVLEDASLGDDLRYYRDDEGKHHVPKLSVEDLVVG